MARPNLIVKEAEIKAEKEGHIIVDKIYTPKNLENKSKLIKFNICCAKCKTYWVVSPLVYLGAGDSCPRCPPKIIEDLKPVSPYAPSPSPIPVPYPRPL